MAKISDLKFEINGVNYCTSINCGVDGLFTSTLPEDVALALNIDKKLRFTTLQSLQGYFKEIIERYKNAATTQELFILIRYGSSGGFNEGNDKRPLHYDKYGVRLSFTSETSNVLLFDFKVCIKEIVDGSINWFESKLGKDFAHWDKEQQSQPDTYFKDKKCYNEKDYKKIPYSDTALETLKNAKEKIRKASEMLYNFITKDEIEIELLLTNQKLLN